MNRTRKGDAALARFVSGDLLAEDRQMISELRAKHPQFSDEQCIQAFIRTLTHTCSECKS